MVLEVSRGGRIIIGADDVINEGENVILTEYGRAKVIRRATRDEFIRFAPQKESVVAEHPPFYYELGIDICPEEILRLIMESTMESPRPGANTFACN